MMVLPLLLLLQNPLQLNPLFTDGAVLQRGVGTPVWGVAAPGAGVMVEIGGQRAGTRADKDGNWMVRLNPTKAGGPYTMVVTSNDGGRTSARDILFGEVWIASGQSNMQFSESGANDYLQAQSETTRDVRMFTVPDVSLETPAKTVKGAWEPSSPLNIGHFSAVALSFAKEINRTLKVPVGIIHTSWGGTPAEAWTSRETLLKNPRLKVIAERYLNSIKDFPAAQAKYKEDLLTWMGERKDGQNLGFESGWGMVEFNDSEWKTTQAPVMIENVEGHEWIGSFWARKSVVLPASWVGKELKLELGPVDDYDTTYFDNVKVGSLGGDVEDAWSTPRVYRISPGIVREGKNEIAVRVYNTAGPGGLSAKADAMKISLADGSESIPITGEWKVRTERQVDLSKPRPVAPLGPGSAWAPGGLYNGMIAPLAPYAIRGAIWYQGEANADRAYQYRELFPTMIQDWRAHWQQGNFPFLFVQLANYTARLDQPAESDWAELREAQTMTLKASPNTGMAVTIDIGEAGDIHPKNKREVGRRLALWALSQTYGKPIPYASPFYTGFVNEGSIIRVTFENGSLATSDGQAPRGFAIAGADKKFYWADARIDGSTVVVSSPKVPKPTAVRYGWANNPDVNLINRVGLPANPFRTDDWPGITANRK